MEKLAGDLLFGLKLVKLSIKLTDHLLTDHLPTTYQPLTDHLRTTYRPFTDHFFTVQLVHDYQFSQQSLCNLSSAGWES